MEEEKGGEVKPVEDNDANDRQYATAEELEQVSSIERYVAWFNWHVREIMPYYKGEVMRLHSITSDEYESSTLEGDRSIYLPQPNPMFEPTHYDERVAHALGLNYQELQDKFKQGELEHKMAGCAVQATTTVGVMKTQTLCFRPIGKNRASTHSVRSSRREHVCHSSSFSKYHKEMLAHYKELLECKNGQVSIHPRFNKLITLCCSTNPVRYKTFRQAMKGFSTRTLSNRLNELEKNRIVERQRYNEIPP